MRQVGRRLLSWCKKKWAYFKIAPFIEPRMGPLFGIITGVCLSLAIELLTKPVITPQNEWGYLQISGVSFLAASFMLGLLTYEIQSFQSYLAERNDHNRPRAIKQDRLQDTEWGRLRQEQIYFALFWILIIIGGIILIIFNQPVSTGGE